MEIIHIVMFVMFAGCVGGMFVAIRNKEVSKLCRALMLMFCTIGIIISSMVVYITPSDEPRYEIVTSGKVFSVEDDFVVVQLGDRLDTIPRNLHPITNWEPVEGNISREIISKETNLVNTANGIVCELITHYKDGSVRRDSISFKNTTKPNSNWEPVR